jgi:hypothetical protein
MNKLSRLAIIALVSTCITIWHTASIKAQAGLDYHVCDCDLGADADCIPGDDSNLGTDPAAPWQTFEKARIEFASLSGGDSIRFCQGGSFDLASYNGRWNNYNCSAASPCTVTNYQPPWASGNEALPLLRKTAAGRGFNLESGGNAVQNSGYIFENLYLFCTVCDLGTSVTGVFLYNDIDDVIIRNMYFDNFTVGVQLAGSNACDGSDPNCNAHNDRLTIENSTFINNHRTGFIGGGNGLVIENSYFENNGYMTPGGATGHHIYLSGSQSPTSGTIIRGNELYRNALLNGACDASSLAAHGEHHDLIIEDNLVREDLGFANRRCWGISVSPAYAVAERFENVIIRRNRVINVGNVSIGLASCVNCLVENNVVIQQQDFTGIGIAVPNRTRSAEDAVGNNVTVRNNSILFTDRGTGIQLNTEGTNHTIVSNAIRYTGSNTGWNCLRANLPASSYTAINNNVCGFSVGEWADGVGNLAAWQSIGWGLNSQAGNPGFTSSINLSPVSGSSPIVNAGHPSLSSVMDINNVTRDSWPDVGAYEWVSPQPTGSPTHQPTATPIPQPTQTPIPQPTESPTPAPPVSTWYLAEGYTGAGFGTFILIQNPNETDANVILTYMLQGGGTVEKNVVVPANSRYTVVAHEPGQVGIDQAFSTRLDADQSIIVERAMYWPNGAGSSGGHVTLGVANPLNTWYLAEGYTGDGFGTFILIQNPNETDANVTLTYMLQGGGIVERNVVVPSNSRYTVEAHGGGQVGLDQAFSTRLDADQPIVVERAMYFNNDGHAAVGVVTPVRSWYLAEGYTGSGFGTFILIQNPSETNANVTLTYMLQGGGTVEKNVVVPASSRGTVVVQDVEQVGADQAFSTRLVSDQPIIVERAMYWPNGESASGGHNSLGVEAAAKMWNFAEGYTGDGFGTFILIQNPNETDANVTLTYMLQGGGMVERDVVVPANSRYTVEAHDAGQVGLAQAFSTQLVSDQPIIVERAMYFNNGGHATGGVAEIE